MSAWLPASPCTPLACVAAPLSAAGPVRRLARLAAAAAVLLGAAAVVRLRGKAGRAAMTMPWSRALLRALGVRVETRRGFAVLGGSVAAVAVPEPAKGALVVANHLSWLDPLVVAATLPCRVLAKREVGSWPFVRGLAAGSGAILIDRERLSGLPHTVAAVADALRAGESVAAFPAGTTWCARTTGPFRPAVFQAAVAAGAPVRPVALRFREGDGTACSAPVYVGDDTLVASLWRVAGVRELVAEITLFPALAVPSGDRRALARLAEACVAAHATEAPEAAHAATPAPRDKARAS